MGLGLQPRGSRRDKCRVPTDARTVGIADALGPFLAAELLKAPNVIYVAGDLSLLNATKPVAVIASTPIPQPVWEAIRRDARNAPYVHGRDGRDRVGAKLGSSVDDELRCHSQLDGPETHCYPATR